MQCECCFHAWGCGMCAVCGCGNVLLRSGPRAQTLAGPRSTQWVRTFPVGSLSRPRSSFFPRNQVRASPSTLPPIAKIGSNAKIQGWRDPWVLELSGSQILYQQRKRPRTMGKLSSRPPGEKGVEWGGPSGYGRVGLTNGYHFLIQFSS